MASKFLPGKSETIGHRGYAAIRKVPDRNSSIHYASFKLS